MPLVYKRSYIVVMKVNCKNVNEDTQGMPQSRSTALQGHQKKERLGIIKIKQAPVIKPMTHKQRRTGTEEPPPNGQ